MAPVSELNRLRRAGLAALEEARLAGWPRLPAPPALVELDGRYNSIRNQRDLSLSGTVGSPAEAWAAIAAGIDRLYLASWLHPWLNEDLAALAAAAGREAVSLVYALPRVAPEKESGHWLRT